MNANIEELKASILNLRTTRDRSVQDGQSVTGIDAQITDLEAQIAAAEQEARTQEIEEKVAAIELPYDFNDLYENSTANDTIIEIVQQFKRQDLEEHNAEIDKLHQLYREQLRAAGEREIQLQRQNEEMQTAARAVGSQMAEVNERINTVTAKNIQLELDKQDAEQKRDNAVAQLEQANTEIAQLKSHIDDLIKEQAVGAREAYKVIESTQTLDQLVARANQEKQARIKSAAELALENSTPFRGKFTLPEVPDVPQQESPFRSQDNTAVPTSIQFPTTETTTTVGGQFPQVQPPALSTVEVRGSQGHGSSSEMAEEERITRADVEAIVEAKFAEYGLVKSNVA